LTARLRLDALAWLAALLPLVGANGAYMISASQELVPWCIPYIEGCTSVSRAARHGEANLFFKALMVPYCVVLPLFWWSAARWLRELAPARRITGPVLTGFGIVAGLAALLYAAALGVEGEFYQFMRRYGINLTFGFTLLAELVLASALANEPRVPPALRRWMVGLCLTMLLLGLASIPLQYFLSTRHPALNSIEWTYSVLMLAFFPLIGAAWRRSAAAHPDPA
jgi:hypothetical protein